MSKKMMRIATVVTFALTLLVSGPVLAQETITVAGTGACQSLLRTLSGTFTAANPGITVQVPDSVGSGGGIKAVANDTVKLARVARKLKDSEKAIGLEYKAFATMPVVFAVHPSLPVMNISSSQARDIFTGKITNWKAIGGPDKKVRVISRHAKEGSLMVLKDSVPGWSDIKLTTKSKMGSNDQETLNFIKSIYGAVGFGAYNQAKDAGLTVLKLDGRMATDSGYPAAIEFGFVYKPATLKGAVRSFVDYMSTADAGKAMKDNFAIQTVR